MMGAEAREEWGSQSEKSSENPVPTYNKFQKINAQNNE
jgi:hypothetical protein